MALILPALEKSWIFGSSLGVSNFLNQATSTVGYMHSSGYSSGVSAPTNAAGDAQNTIYKLVNSMVNTYGGNAWQLVANSYYPGSGATSMLTSTVTNGWTSGQALQWDSDGNDHSWIILKQSGMQGVGAPNPAMLCIDLAMNAAYCYIHVYFSPGGLYDVSSLSTTTKPIAADEISFGILSPFSSANCIGTALHVMQSLDGYSTRAIILQGGVIVFSMFLEGIVPDGSSNLAYKMACTAQSGVVPGSNWMSNTNFWCRANGGNFNALCTCESTSGTAIPNYNGGAISDFTGGYAISPVGLISSTIGARGKVGRFVDLWLGSSAVPSMTTYPLSGGKNFIQVGQLVLPWDGATVPIINA